VCFRGGWAHSTRPIAPGRAWFHGTRYRFRLLVCCGSLMLQGGPVRGALQIVALLVDVAQKLAALRPGARAGGLSSPGVKSTTSLHVAAAVADMLRHHRSESSARARIEPALCHEVLEIAYTSIHSLARRNRRKMDWKLSAPDPRPYHPGECNTSAASSGDTSHLASSHGFALCPASICGLHTRSLRFLPADLLSTPCDSSSNASSKSPVGRPTSHWEPRWGAVGPTQHTLTT
jgi:hypothetical protein